MARIQAVSATKPVVYESESPLEWGAIQWAQAGAFEDVDVPEPDAGERVFHTIAVQRGQKQNSDIACVAVLGVTRDLEVGLEERFEATVDGEAVNLVGRDGVPATFCKSPPENSGIPAERREAFGRVLERAHGVDPAPTEGDN